MKIYDVTKPFPKEERYGMTYQIRKAASAIASNIAEGSGGSSDEEFLQYLNRALRSQNDVVTLLRLCHQLNFVRDEHHEELLASAEEVGHLIEELIDSLKKSTGDTE